MSPKTSAMAVDSIASSMTIQSRSEKGLPKAMVKPSVVNQNNILTHVIEGFVIQEGVEPFPVTRLRSSNNVEEEPPSKFKFYRKMKI